VRIEITGFAPPCNTIRESFNDHNFTRISHKVHPGESRLYARILQEGTVRPGDAVQVLSEQTLTSAL